MLNGHKLIIYDNITYDNITFNFELGLKSALLACRCALKSAFLACCRALKVPFSWKLYHGLFWTGGNTYETGSIYLINLHQRHFSGADPGFRDRGFKFTKGGLICLFYVIIY